ncbi:hypothetical protein A3843_16240 [Pseudovibrio exalbescens]|uniref:Uncharacterized protein n=2 Tax=Pseudovibrio exalbescens TaxID=197461 RepID=A0A1U7JDS3_9HYPH|nr:hypothetical protein A3843_16240 [Pseudovibrio exalbescens]
MWLVVQTNLGKGGAAPPVCIPPAIGSFRALNPFQSQQNVSPFHHSQAFGRCTTTWEGASKLPQDPHGNFIETNPARIGSRHRLVGGSRAGDFALPAPIDQEAIAPP